MLKSALATGNMRIKIQYLWNQFKKKKIHGILEKNVQVTSEIVIQTSAQNSRNNGDTMKVNRQLGSHLSFASSQNANFVRKISRPFPAFANESSQIFVFHLRKKM